MELEELEIKIVDTDPMRRTIVGIEKDWEQKKIYVPPFLIMMDFDKLYPNDEILIYGQFKQNHLFGRYFEGKFYRELLNGYWILKWLKIKKNLKDHTILKEVKKGTVLTNHKQDVKELLAVKKVHRFLEEKNVPIEVLAQIEHDFRWNKQALLYNPYTYLKYPNIHLPLVQKIATYTQKITKENHNIDYFVSYYLSQSYRNGHYFLPKKELIKQITTQGIKEEEIDHYFSHPPKEIEWVERSQNLYFKEKLNYEMEVAKDILKRLSIKPKGISIEKIEEWEKKKFGLAKNQKIAVEMALKENFCIVTGGPGVGKTTVCQCITDILGEEFTIQMVAPTGRAAKRAQESTGLPTCTVHSLLKYNGETFQVGENNQIKAKVLVVDESSMIDMELLYYLLKAVPLGTKIIFVGDVDQLPSVGAGQILRDMIESNIIPVTKLTEIFRQAADSPIITVAYAVNRGEYPENTNHPDLIMEEIHEEKEVARKTLEIATELYQNNNLYDVQVLIPMYGGEVGIDAINKELQQKLNPNEKGIVIKHYEIRKNDKVIQTENVKSKNIFNGDVGIVKEVSEREIKVSFQDREELVSYAKEEFYQLKLSYAITVHRSQGSEYKFVIIPTVFSYSVMLQKNLLYTAITRAKKKLWMFYQPKALHKSVQLESVPLRNTTLKELIQEYQIQSVI